MLLFDIYEKCLKGAKYALTIRRMFDMIYVISKCELFCIPNQLYGYRNAAQKGQQNVSRAEIAAYAAYYVRRSVYVC